jgi:ubiquinone/menaquinone biosynthesis C-methylase UbiE
MSESFSEGSAARYEAWYKTPEGQRADRLERAALARMLTTFPEARTLLEVGCGTAHFTRWLNAQGWKALGLDISRPMLEQASVLNGRLLVRGDALRLPFSDAGVDLSMMVTTLEFLERPSAAVAESLRVSRLGLVLGVLNRCSFLGMLRRWRGLFRRTVYDDARFFSIRGLQQLLQLPVPEAEVRDWVTTLYPSIWPFRQPWGRWGGFIAMAVARGGRGGPASPAR